jgi:hypothetical protein
VSPAWVRARRITTRAPMMCSSTTGLFAGGSTTAHIITYMRAPATAATRMPTPRISAVPIAARPSMNAQFVQLSPAIAV